MDVRCDRCKAEYEFDDARVTEAGVAVKCTNCGYVFKIQKKSVAYNVPVEPQAAVENRSAAVAPAPAVNPGSAAIAPGQAVNPGPNPATSSRSDKKEWKLRQRSGSTTSFRELTTLQKWIVERKLTRDDEISLTGETWKRLGDIPELQSFFQVVDEANLARLMSLPAEGKQKVARAAQPSFEIPEHGSVPAGGSPNWSPRDEVRTRARTDQAVRSALRDDFLIGQGPEWKWLLVMATVVVLAGVYFFWPRAQPPVAVAPAPREERGEPPKPEREESPAVAPPAVIDSGTAEAVPDIESTAVAAQTLDAGPPATAKSKAVTFESLLAKGDRLREADKPEAALEAYQKGIDLRPTRAEPFTGRGLAYLDMGQPGMAETEFKQALRLNPRHGAAIMGIAETYRILGRKDDAIEYYQLYLEELPRGPEAAIAQTQIQRLQE